MMMVGILCDGCGKDLLDSGNKCSLCGHPYSEFQLKMVSEHQRAKEHLVSGGAGKTEAQMMEDIQHLATASEGLAALAKAAGGNVSKETIRDGFSLVDTRK